MELYKARITNPCKGVKRRKSGQAVQKQFAFGQTITGRPENGSMTPDSHILIFRTTDGFMLPMHSVNVLGKLHQDTGVRSEDIEDAVLVEDKATIDPAQIKKIKTMFNASGPVSLQQSIQKTKSNMYGGMIGAGVGLVYALSKGKNKWLFITIGAVGGYILGTAYHQYFKADDESKIQKAK